MLKELVIKSLNQLKSFSLYKISLCLFIGLYFNKIILYILLFIYLLFDDYKKALFYLLLLSIFLFFFKYKYDFIPLGIIDYKKGNYYIINKFLYKTKIEYDSHLKVGDILITDIGLININENEIYKNIIYLNNSYTKLSTLLLKNTLYEYIDSFNNEYRSIYLSMFYNYNNYESTLNYSINYSYIFTRIVKKINNKYLIILILFIYSYLFGFQTIYLFILLDLLLNKCESLNVLSIKLLFVLFINIKLLNNYSILIPLIYSLINKFNSKNKYEINIIISSLLFYEVNLINVFGYNYLINIKSIILIFSLISLGIPYFQNIVFKILNIIDKSKIFKLSIRGKISIFVLIIYILIVSIIKNKYLKILILILLIINPINHINFKVSFIDVGQGDSILISDNFNKANILIDTGSSYNYYKLKKYLYKEGIYRIDYLVITHDDEDHNGNELRLKEDFKIDNIIKTKKDISINNIYLRNYDLGDFDNDNDNSLVYDLDINGFKFLFTGDISSNSERVFINKYGNSKYDVIKASHHGSNSGNSLYFISNLLPDYVIFSTNGMYNHPHFDVVNNYKKYLVESFSTKDDGTISFIFTRYFNFIKSDKFRFVII